MKQIKIISLLVLLFLTTGAYAQENSMNMAQMHAMDKITGRVSIIDVPVGGEVKFGSFSVVVRSCKTNPEEEMPENFAFVDVTDKSFDNVEFNIFKGWMFSSKPAVNAVEHPIYDVWLLKCFEGNPDAATLLSEEELKKRDDLPRLQDVRRQQNNKFDEQPQENILFKDSMYKEEKSQNETSVEKSNGEPENLLNIQDDYQLPEEKVKISPENISQVVEEAPVSEDENKQEETSSIDDELARAIEKELSQHQ